MPVKLLKRKVDCYGTQTKDGVYSTREITQSLKVTQLEDVKKGTDFLRTKTKLMTSLL